MIKVVISGAGGRMGKLLLRAVTEEEGMELAGAVEGESHPLIGKDAGNAAGIEKCGVEICSNLEKIHDEWDVLVEFSIPEAVLQHLSAAAGKSKCVVIGTTGFTREQKDTIKDFGSKIPVLLSPNMSIGVNLLFKIAGETAKVLGPEYDVEIVETHHRLKKDAPSGTALKLAESIADSRGQDISSASPPSRGRIKEGGFIYGRHGTAGERTIGEIGIHAVRGGTVAGEHTAIFAGQSERIELTHRAESRDVFVRGTIAAVKFIAGAKPGFYDMQDVLGKVYEKPL